MVTTEYKPPIPGYDFQANLPTYQDAVEYVLDLFAASRAKRRDLRLAKQAVRTAYRDLALGTEWRYYYRRAILTTSAMYSSGTIAYTSSTRTVDLTDGMFPSWAANGRIVIDDVEYNVESRASDGSSVVLREHSTPGIDVAAGTTYQLVRPYYPLPNDFRTMVLFQDTQDESSVYATDLASLTRHQIYDVSTPGTPLSSSIGNQGSFYHNLSIEFYPVPEEARNYAFAYYAWPRPLQIEKFSSGLVAVSGTTCTINRGTLPSNCVGSILRLSATATEQPTGPDGSIDNDDNYYTSARVITERTSATEFEIDSAPGDETGVMYTISDPLHLSPTMQSAFEVCASYEFCKRVRSPKDRTVSLVDKRRAIMEARQGELVSQTQQAREFREFFRDYDMEEYAS